MTKENQNALALFINKANQRGYNSIIGGAGENTVIVNLVFKFHFNINDEKIPIELSKLTKYLNI